MFIEPASRREPPHLRTGWIEVISGSMFSGKTEELIRRLTRARIARLHVVIVKPGVDTRYHDADIVSHNALSINSIPVEKAADILLHTGNCDVVGIDEAQFFIARDPRLHRRDRGHDDRLRAVPDRQQRGGDGRRRPRAARCHLRAPQPVAEPRAHHRRLRDGGGVRGGLPDARHRDGRPRRSRAGHEGDVRGRERSDRHGARDLGRKSAPRDPPRAPVGELSWPSAARMEIYQLQTFVVVAHEGSITRASERLHLSQPAVSAHVKALEVTIEESPGQGASCRLPLR